MKRHTVQMAATQTGLAWERADQGRAERLGGRPWARKMAAESTGVTTMFYGDGVVAVLAAALRPRMWRNW